MLEKISRRKFITSIFQIGVGGIAGSIIENRTNLLGKTYDALTNNSERSPAENAVSYELRLLNKVPQPKHILYSDIVLKEYYAGTKYEGMVDRAREGRGHAAFAIELMDPDAGNGGDGDFNFVGLLPNKDGVVNTPRILDLVDAILAREKIYAHLITYKTGTKLNGYDILRESFEARDAHAVVAIFQPKKEPIDNPKTARIQIYADPQYFEIATPAHAFENLGHRTAFVTTSAAVVNVVTWADKDASQFGTLKNYYKNYHSLLYHYINYGAYAILPGNDVDLDIK